MRDNFDTFCFHKELAEPAAKLTFLGGFPIQLFPEALCYPY